MRRCDAGFHPTPKLRRQNVAEHRFHSPFVNRVEGLAKQIEAAKTLELELYVRTVSDGLSHGASALRWKHRRFSGEIVLSTVDRDHLAV
jgi:hypothetical protein